MPDDRDIAAVAGPERPGMPHRAIWAVLTSGLVAATLLPDSRPGISFAIVALVVAMAVVIALPRMVTVHEAVFGAFGIALTVMPAWRAAGWILAFDLLAATGLACLAVTSAATWRALFKTPFEVLARMRWVPGALARPVVERLRESGAGRIGAHLRTLGVSLALIVVFGTLFMSADAAFAQLANSVLLPDLRVDMAVGRVMTFGIVALMTGALVLRRSALQTSDGAVVAATESPARKTSEWALPIAVLDVLFLSFVAVQMTVLFGGSHHVELTPGLTYAEYARQGFFQLLAVAALVLAVVSVTLVVARPRDDRTKRIAQALLGALCLLTLVVLASAWYRLGVYEDVYGLTRLRLSVYGAIVWLGVIFSLLIAAGVVWKSTWLPRAVVAITAAGLLVFTIANPDRLIAERNVDRYEATGKIDLSYLGTLSEDAVPVLVQLPEEMRDCVLSQIAWSSGTRDDFGWSEWNYSRSSARATLERLDIPVTPSASCYSY